MNEVPEKYRKRLTENANQFDQIVIDICNEACEHKLEAERWRLQHKDVLANCNDISKTFSAYRESSQKVVEDRDYLIHELKIKLRDESLNHYKTKELLATYGNWIDLDEFLKEPTEGLCWIIYKDLVIDAYCHHNGSFSYSKNSLDRYMTECISGVIPIREPLAPIKAETVIEKAS